jgi:hypothetical protein
VRQWSDWAHGHVGLDFIPFNARTRDECLNINGFWSLAQTRVVISDWKHDYNQHRRHAAQASNRRPATLPAVFTNERPSFAWTSSRGPVTKVFIVSPRRRHQRPWSVQQSDHRWLYTPYIRPRKRLVGLPRAQSSARRHMSVSSAREIFCD